MGDKYKIKMRFEVNEGKKVLPIELTAKLYKVADQDKICIDVNRNDGDVYAFYKQFEVIKDFLGDIADTTYLEGQ